MQDVWRVLLVFHWRVHNRSQSIYMCSVFLVQGQKGVRNPSRDPSSFLFVAPEYGRNDAKGVPALRVGATKRQVKPQQEEG